MGNVNRQSDFSKIAQSLDRCLQYTSKTALVSASDAITVLRRIEDRTISLVLTDPPYHSTKKKNIANDRAFDEDQDYLNWLQEYMHEWRRVLRPNGSLLLFCSSTMAARIEVLLSSDFNILSQIVWTKPNDPGFDGWKQKMNKQALRQWYAHSERIIFAEPAWEGNLRRSYFANYLRAQRRKAGISAHYLAEVTGAYGKVNHGGAVSNWETGRNIPSKVQYDKLCRALLETGKIDKMPPYEDVIRPFSVNSTMEFTDVWTFPSVRPYSGKHPAEKPIDMLKHAIEATTFAGDIVLDCFAGSGTTAYAALATGRLSISIELEEKWANTISGRIRQIENGSVSKDLQNSMLRDLEYQPLLFGIAK